MGASGSTAIPAAFLQQMQGGGMGGGQPGMMAQQGSAYGTGGGPGPGAQVNYGQGVPSPGWRPPGAPPGGRAGK